jgi:hypothetical protein
VEVRARDGRCAVIEVNGRLGQDDGFPELFERLLGRPPLLLWLDALAADAPLAELPPPAARGCHALAYVNHYAGGTFRGARVPDGAPEPEVRVLLAPGTRLHPAGHPQFDPHVVCALASHPTSPAAALAAAQRALRAVAVSIAPAQGAEAVSAASSA